MGVPDGSVLEAFLPFLGPPSPDGPSRTKRSDLLSIVDFIQQHSFQQAERLQRLACKRLSSDKQQFVRRDTRDR